MIECEGAKIIVLKKLHLFQWDYYAYMFNTWRERWLGVQILNFNQQPTPNSDSKGKYTEENAKKMYKCYFYYFITIASKP